MLLGITGDQVLPKDIYNQIKKETLTQVRGTVQADILKRGSSSKYLYFFNRVCS